MTLVRVAGYNVENLFARPRAFGPMSEAASDAAVVAHADFNRLIAKAEYSDADRTQMRELLTILGIYVANTHGALRRSSSPRWAWLRKNRGHFDRQPRDATEDVTITATGRAGLDRLGGAAG